MTLQRTVGNAAVNRIIHAGTLQREEAEPQGVTLEGYKQAAIAAINQLGAKAAGENVDVDFSEGGMMRFSVRLGQHGNAVLPSSQTIEAHTKAGDAAPGSIEGAPKLLLGALQQFEGLTRITVRVVRTETAEILTTGKGDTDGTNEAAVQKAIVLALRDMGSLWKKRRK